MKFSFSLVPSSPIAKFGDVIAEAESWGYDLAWTPDQGFMHDPFVALSYLMTRTEKIALGVGITNSCSIGSSGPDYFNNGMCIV